MAQYGVPDPRAFSPVDGMEDGSDGLRKGSISGKSARV